MLQQGNVNSILSIFISLSVILCLVAILTLVAVYPQYSYTGEQTQYAVVFPPSISPTDIYTQITTSDGTPVRSATFDFIMIAASDNPEFITNIRKLGAILVFSPIIKGGCLIENHARFRKK